MTIKAGDIVTYHRDPKEAAAEVARQAAGQQAAEQAEAALKQVEAALSGVPEETRRNTLGPLQARLNEARDAAQAWSAPEAKALVSFVHADGTVDVLVTGAPALMQRTGVPIGPQAPARDYITAA